MQQNSDYETLISKKISLINDFESGKKRYLNTPQVERPDTPQFSDRKNVNNTQIVSKPNLQIHVNWQLLSDCLQEKNYTELDFLSFMSQLYILVDSQFWKLCLILAYSEDNWAHQTTIAHEKIMKILGLIFDCVQSINEQKIAQVEEVINYRSIAHLDRLLFAHKLPQFEKFITIIRQQILNNPHQAFQLKEAKIIERQFDSFAKIQAYKSYTPTKPSSKGMQRSEMLYNHSKQLQEKVRNGYLVRVKQETEELKSFQKQKRSTSDNEVFDRLFNVSKQCKQVQPKEEIDKECTFKPEILTTIVTKSDQKLEQIPGFENTIKRMQKAQNEKEYKEKYFEIKQSQLEKVNNQGVKEFKLSEREENEEPILFLDVRISKNKIGRLGVRKNDDLKQVVQNFAKTFSLQNSQIEALQKHIKSALEMLNKQ